MLQQNSLNETSLTPKKIAGRFTEASQQSHATLIRLYERTLVVNYVEPRARLRNFAVLLATFRRPVTHLINSTHGVECRMAEDRSAVRHFVSCNWIGESRQPAN